MSRVEQHISAARVKLTLGLFLETLARAALVAAVAWLLAVVAQRLVHVSAPRLAWWIGAGVLALGALVMALWRRPTAQAAAVAIDERLGLKEKFSTALHIARSTDVVARAALADAEATAARVSIRGLFPTRFPRIMWKAAGVALLALAAVLWLPSMDLFGRKAAAVQKAQVAQRQEPARQAVSQALKNAESLQRANPASAELINPAKQELLKAMNEVPNDAAKAERTALRVQQELAEALKKEAQKAGQAAAEQQRLLNALTPDAGDPSPLAQAQRELAKGNLDQAMAELDKVVKEFDKMPPEKQKEAAEKMQAMAQKLQQQAADPKNQQQMQQALQKAGANPQQAQQLAQLAQQAAAGNQQAQQQLAQQMQQMAQQMGPQQAQQLQQAMQQCQGQAGAQNQANQLGQGMQQLAQAMHQAAGQQGQGQQPGQGNQPGNNGQMQQGAQAVQQAMQNMQAMQQDAQAAAAAQQQAQQGAQQAADGMGGKNGGEGEGGAGQGEWAAGDPGQGQPGGQGGPGKGAGGSMPKQAAPYGVVRRDDPTFHDPKGQIIASTLVKDGMWIKGEKSEQVRKIVESAEKDQTDEVDDWRTDRQSQELAKEYFRTMSQDSKSTDKKSGN